MTWIAGVARRVLGRGRADVAVKEAAAETERQERLLAASDKAVEALRRVLMSAPDAVEVRARLAETLVVRARTLCEMERFAEALPPGQEGAEFYRALAASDPEGFEPELLSAFHVYSVILGNLGRTDEALTFAEESLSICRRLAAADPDREPALADALTLCGSLLTRLERPAEASAANQEALEISRLRMEAARERAEAAISKFMAD